MHIFWAHDPTDLTLMETWASDAWTTFLVNVVHAKHCKEKAVFLSPGPAGRHGHRGQKHSGMGSHSLQPKTTLHSVQMPSKHIVSIKRSSTPCSYLIMVIGSLIASASGDLLTISKSQLVTTEILPRAVTGSGVGAKAAFLSGGMAPRGASKAHVSVHEPEKEKRQDGFEWVLSKMWQYKPDTLRSLWRRDWRRIVSIKIERKQFKSRWFHMQSRVVVFFFLEEVQPDPYKLVLLFHSVCRHWFKVQMKPCSPTVPKTEAEQPNSTTLGNMFVSAKLYRIYASETVGKIQHEKNPWLFFYNEIQC